MINSDVNKDFDIDKDAQLRKVKEEILLKLVEYRNTIYYMASDAPISILCLPRSTENVLLASGLLRVYDLLNSDLTKIEGLTADRIRHLTSCLDQFLAML